MGDLVVGCLWEDLTIKSMLSTRCPCTPSFPRDAARYSSWPHPPDAPPPCFPARGRSSSIVTPCRAPEAPSSGSCPGCRNHSWLVKPWGSIRCLPTPHLLVTCCPAVGWVFSPQILLAVAPAFTKHARVLLTILCLLGSPAGLHPGPRHPLSPSLGAHLRGRSSRVQPRSLLDVPPNIIHIFVPVTGCSMDTWNLGPGP